jgi:hypothetical protein
MKDKAGAAAGSSMEGAAPAISERPLPTPRPPEAGGGDLDQQQQQQPPQPTAEPLPKPDVGTIRMPALPGEPPSRGAVLAAPQGVAAGIGGAYTAGLGMGTTAVGGSGSGRPNKRMPRDPVTNARICFEYVRGACPRPPGTCRYAHVIPHQLSAAYQPLAPPRPLGAVAGAGGRGSVEPCDSLPHHRGSG